MNNLYPCGSMIEEKLAKRMKKNEDYIHPAGWFTAFPPPTSEDVLCCGRCGGSFWFVGVYFLQDYWITKPFGTEPDYVTAWLPIPGYPYSKEFMDFITKFTQYSKENPNA